MPSCREDVEDEEENNEDEEEWSDMDMDTDEPAAKGKKAKAKGKGKGKGKAKDAMHSDTDSDDDADNDLTGLGIDFGDTAGEDGDGVWRGERSTRTMGGSAGMRLYKLRARAGGIRTPLRWPVGRTYLSAWPQRTRSGTVLQSERRHSTCLLAA
jgi:hypothetical protein